MLLTLADGKLAGEPEWLLLSEHAGDGHRMCAAADWMATIDGGRAVEKTGLLVQPDTDLSAVPAEIQRAAVIGLLFPTFTDGRLFSQAKRLRQQYGYQGQLIAVGSFLPDQVSFLLRCGVDGAFFSDDERAEQAKQMLAPFCQPYQVTLGTEKKPQNL